MILFPGVKRAQTVQAVNCLHRYAKYLHGGLLINYLPEARCQVSVHVILANTSGKLNTIMMWVGCTNITGESGERKGELIDLNSQLKTHLNDLGAASVPRRDPYLRELWAEVTANQTQNPIF